MRQLAIGAHVPAAALALAAGLGGCFTGPAPDVPTDGVPVLLLSTTALSFAAPAGAADPAPQAIRVDDGGGSGTLAAPTTSINYAGNGGWLSAAVAGSAPPYTITVRASVASIAAGSYAAILDVASPGAASSPQHVAVTLTVGSTSQPTMAVAPAALTFTSTGGARPPAQTVTVSNAGVGTLAQPVVTTSYTGQPSGWLTATVSGTAAPYTITVQADPTGIQPRPVPYTATMSVDCPGASNTPVGVTIQLTVR